MFPILIALGAALLVLWGARCCSVSVMDSNTWGIGRWTATAVQKLGQEYIAPALGTQSTKKYMYVQYVKGSGPDVYDGTPIGFTATLANGVFTVSGDESAVLGSKHCRGVIRSNGGSTAVTTNYYGWIQVAENNQILDSVAVKTAAAAGDQVDWVADGILNTAAAFNSTLNAMPFGVVLTPAKKGAAPGTTANQISDIIVLL